MTGLPHRDSNCPVCGRPPVSEWPLAVVMVVLALVCIALPIVLTVVC